MSDPENEGAFTVRIVPTLNVVDMATSEHADADGKLYVCVRVACT